MSLNPVGVYIGMKMLFWESFGPNEWSKNKEQSNDPWKKQEKERIEKMDQINRKWDESWDESKADWYRISDVAHSKKLKIQ